ncbi:5'-AMP-activated protein kinase subunit gamma-2 [Plutella xylostella]|uniref:5'-AMP-activated protein kinase subunit gamma-2 n=1 Tax=Plutella xylostella TaxID=51655 RepID=UPI002032C3F0|nr:5'-AMP-activated protein kinase subunit gamma-2 [Plutella xylostella]XP_011556348.3 5'-AMP-activated protein kinase subunit gamma-2 [Plutella xylostella]XP_011556349.3 5'-AMP-activated protein kinase subunit gamma-2 [Plutella xylostella]XP_011556350.3 5'-AMP-activated protein kinase subunit gamma-2 [Plutella xylostella]XP_037977018.2 5'-AMP-activated protein kinase subunit gamma-2 [Plutella xylostella]
MDPILENEASSSETPTKYGKSKHKNKKKKSQDAQSGSQTVVGERRKFVVTKLPVEAKEAAEAAHNNAHTVHFGTRGAEAQRPHARSLFARPEPARPASAEREPLPKEYETFHGTSSSPRSSIFDMFRLRRKSDAKKHQSLIQNVKGALTGASRSTEAPEASKDDPSSEESGKSDKKYYHTVTGASSRKYSPITRVMDIFRSKPHTEDQKPAADPVKKKSGKQPRRSSIGTTSPTYQKNSYASLDPVQAKQLFREVRGLPKYDPYLSIVQISLGGRDKTRLLLNFFKYHKCYEMLPKSAKVIIFDTQFLVRKTFPTLISHGIRSAPLWDSTKKQLVGMITVTDFIRILLHLEAAGTSVDELERHTLHAWKRLLRPSRKPLCVVGPDQSLHEAINYLNKHRVHRLLLVDPVCGDVLYILSHKRILRFLFVYLNEFPELTFFHKNLVELKIGTYDNIVSVTESTSIKTAFQLLLEKDISALPILDENKKLLDVYAKYEVLNLVSEKIYSDLSVTIGEVRNKKKDWEEKLQKCRSSITLYEALEVIVRTESHRLLLVDKEDKLIGIVSLSDILVYLNRIIPTEKKVSSLQELFKPLEENKVTESVKETENEDIVLEVPVLNSTSNGPNKIIAEVSEENEDEKGNTGVLESDGTEVQNDVTDCAEIEHASNNTDSDIESSLNIEPIELHISE